MEQNIQNVQAQNSSGNILVRKLGTIFSVFIFLLPVFFVPIDSVGLYTAKITLLASGLVAIFAVFLSSVLSTGVIEIPKVKYLIPIIIFAVVALISSALTGVINISIAGDVIDLGSSGSILMLVFALFMTVVAIKSTGAVSKVISAFIYSTLALAVYTLVSTIGASLLPAVMASRMPVFLAGGIIDTAIIFGAAVILALCALNMTELSKKMKYILLVLIAFSILFVGAANFMPVVVILGIISLIFFVYILSWSFGRPSTEISGGEGAVGQENNRKISLSSLVVLIAMVVLVLGGSGIGGYLSSVMKIQSVEIRPNFQTTMNLTVNAWKQNFAFGVGPNRFVEFWSANKPSDINQTQFWNSDFYFGSGFVPTLGITTGLLGLIALLVFIAMYVMNGIKAIFAQANAGRSRYLATATFLVSLYLWVILFLYTPSITVLTLAFIFTGLFTVTLVPQGIAGLWRINVFSNPKTNFLSVLATVVLLIMSVAGGYFVWERSVAATTFQNGILKYQKTGDIATARLSVIKSINLVNSDTYWRGLTEISLADLGRVLGGITNESQVTDAIRTEIQTLIANSIESAKKAVEIDKTNFRNWFALGRVYEILASNGIEGSLENARSAYAEAILLSPKNPSVPLALARLDILENKAENARANIVKSLELKNNYTDAYYSLAQLEVAVNNIPEAIRSVEAIIFIEPNNSGLYLQLGLLKYNQKDYSGAAAAFEKSVALVPDYANAKYFLGLSYYQLGKKDEAIKQFNDLSLTNPDNQEIDAILKIMKSGKPLFQSTTAESVPPVRE